MDRGTREAVLGPGVAATTLAGIGLVIVGDITLATVGILLIILSAIGFLVVVKDFIVGRESVGAR